MRMPRLSIASMENFRGSANLKFNKTEKEYNMKSIRILLLMITAMFMMIATLMICLGVSVYSNYHDFTFFYEGARNSRMLSPSVMCIFSGLMLLILTSFGFFGSLMRSTCMVNMYALFLALLLIIKLVVVVLAFTTDRASIAGLLNISIVDYANDPEVSSEIDSLQTSLNCCGNENFLDYIGIQFTGNHSVVSYYSTSVEGDLIGIMLPSSCCSSVSDEYCEVIRNTGCKDALIEFIVQNAGVLGVMGMSVCCVELLGIVFALLLARCIRKLKSEQAFLAWRIREQMILARKLEESDKSNGVYITSVDSSNS